MRAIWKGSLSFGLVNIPVHLYSATREKEFSFTLLHKKDHSEIRYARICKTEEKEVPWNEIVKGYELEKGDYIIFDEKDFEQINLKKTKTIEILNFIHQEEIDSVYFVKPYFLEPEKNAANAYQLLRDALKKSNKVGLAKYVLHNREHLAVLKVHDDILILNEMRFQTELIDTKEIHIPEKEKFKGKELEIAIQLIDQLTTSFNPKIYKDTYIQELKDMIKKKAKGKPIQPKKGEPEKITKVHDIMSLLKASLENQKGTKKKTRGTA